LRVATIGAFPSLDTVGHTFTLSFDYLGTCGHADCGGFGGVDPGLPSGNEIWLAGSQASYPGLRAILQDTGAWTHASITFAADAAEHVKLEQFQGSSGAPGTVYFDNIVLGSSAPVPEVGSWALMLGGLGALAGMVRRRARG
jgi:hypothetical protein